MALKRYQPRYVKTYTYKDPDSGEADDIVFMANGYLFPLFKSYAGVELGTALDDYKKSLTGVLNEDTVRLMTKFETATTPDERLAVILEDPELIVKMVREAQNTDDIGGMSMIEYLLIVMRVCALPEADHAEALGLGYELLPQEVYEDTALAFELLGMAMNYDTAVKKNSKFRKN